MIAEESERGLVDVGSREEDAVDEPTDSLNSVERDALQHQYLQQHHQPQHQQQHQNDNNSNLDLGMHHRDLSHHPHHPLDNSSDPTNALFSHQQHLQPHPHDLNGNDSSADINHISGSVLLQQHLLNLPNLHHQQPPLQSSVEQQHHHRYQLQQQLLQQQGHHLHNLNLPAQQQQQHSFSFHHEQHTSGDEENDDIVEATTALLHQDHEHQLALAMVYHPPYSHQDQQQAQQQQQHQGQEQEQLSPSVDPTQTSVGMGTSMFPPPNSPLTLPPHPYTPNLKKTSKTADAKNYKSILSSTISNKGDVSTSKITAKKRQHKQESSIINDGAATEPGSLGIVRAKKPRRRRYDNNFKAEVLNHLKGPHTKLSDVARRYGIPENTLREWTKLDVVRAIQTARSKNSGQLKANMYDPMKRLTETLMVFFEHNRRQPDQFRQSITTKLIVAKGLEARKTLLQRNATHPFLDPKERKALENFTGSNSWAKKFAKRRDLKMTGARVKEMSEEDVNQLHYSLKQMSNRVRQAGPGYEDAAVLMRQAAEKLLLANIIHSNASHSLMDNIAVSNSRDDRKMTQVPSSMSGSYEAHRHDQMDNQASKLQPDQLVQSHLLRH